MKNYLFVSTIIIGMTVIMGDMNARDYNPPENVSKYVGKTDLYLEEYVRCLAENGGIHHARQYKNAPERSTIKQACLNIEDDLYKAAYIDSFDNQEVDPARRDSTARALIRQTDDEVMGVEKVVSDEDSSSINQSVDR